MEGYYRRSVSDETKIDLIRLESKEEMYGAFHWNLTSDNALMIFQSSRAYTGGVTALLVCWALPSVLT